MTGGTPVSGDLKTLRGTVLDGRYPLEEWLGEGGFGGVFRSRQRLLGAPVRRVAVKLSRRTGLTEANVRDLFGDALLLAEAMDGMTDTEARAHLVHLYDAGVADGRGYLVMEYVQGTTLAAQFASLPGGVPARLMTRWARQVAVALRGLHSLTPPLLHRDLKPDNVLLGLDRTVRLVDFGLAARMVAGGHVEGVAGTLAYMAPETWRGRSVRASDLYSLGLLIYEGLTGRHPYGHLHPPYGLPADAHGDWLYEARREIIVDPPSRLNNTVPPALDALVLRCLAHDPRDRFGTAEELIEAIDEPAPAAPARPAPRGAAADLVREADLLADRGDHAGAARRYERAWRTVRDDPAAPDDRAERVALLDRLSRAYRRIGNDFQADRYAELSRREGGGDR
ncbi:serine/threonine-protein kinase [Actinomadura kijaniata]|uniref:serine/threonine-protein kinase n=1 Tax=Actinomadura kijaniata TaxID=46161 RepID=UPI000831F5A0|nr:serine/threonine-protein kinase [Actinomadura kijaniata]